MQKSVENPPSTSSNLHHEIAGIALSLRIPPFWRDKPRLWFISFEAATSELKKSQSQLAQMVIAQLDKVDIEQISDLLYKPPEAETYEILKKRLITVYEESASRQFQKLLTDMELGDQKPSQLLRRMRSLARDQIPDTTLRLMWMNHLPAHVRSLLAVCESFQKETALDELASLADKMVETSAASHVSAVSTSSGASQPHSDTHYLVEEIRKLTVEVASIKKHQQQQQQQQYRPYDQRNRSPSRNNNSKSPRGGSPVPYCYYHRRFGRQARRCTTPCSYKNDKSEN